MVQFWPNHVMDLCMLPILYDIKLFHPLRGVIKKVGKGRGMEIGYKITDSEKRSRGGGECNYLEATIVFVHCALSVVNLLLRRDGVTVSHVRNEQDFGG